MLKRRDVLLGLAGLPILGTIRPAFAAEPNVLTTSAGDLSIIPVRHASLVLTIGDSALYFDPAGGPAPFEGLPPPTAIFITHAHGDHFDMATLNAVAGDTAPILTSEEVFARLPAALKERATAVANGASAEFAGIPVDVIAAYNTTEARQRYHPPGVGNGYVLNIGGKRIYVAGDTEDTAEMRALEAIDVAFLPMNLPYTMSAEQLAAAVTAFKPAVVYPYHYQGGKLDKVVELIGNAAEVRLAEWYPA
ncbi:MBL fold metallo-hydrolase [Devosia sp. ZB163]|uniref:MBL fold metallo-hydrolase n=1 Tax=Devosia sp. ZB163 TaxID=3025938 RepID=UPI00235F4ED5|nr:MBL fold metallo-hydrolase [Devosia sp. ZB163]MDC9822101.1 MBL fold metallo-hydrolase [Devosia sp. ZB163]